MVFSVSGAGDPVPVVTDGGPTALVRQCANCSCCTAGQCMRTMCTDACPCHPAYVEDE